MYSSVSSSLRNTSNSIYILFVLRARGKERTNASSAIKGPFFTLRKNKFNFRFAEDHSMSRSEPQNTVHYGILDGEVTLMKSHNRKTKFKR
jgi:hypothetical protein